MPRKAWSDKRERQYEHIKEGYEKHGKSEATAEEIAARTVNKERAQHGEARHASAQSLRCRRPGAARWRGPTNGRPARMRECRIPWKEFA